jgi:hypothetical protein
MDVAWLVHGSTTANDGIRACDDELCLCPRVTLTHRPRPQGWGDGSTHYAIMNMAVPLMGVPASSLASAFSGPSPASCLALLSTGLSAPLRTTN